MVFFGSKKFQVFLRRNFNIHTKPVGIHSGLVYQLLTGSRNAFHMNIAIEPVYKTQFFDDTYHSFHGVVGRIDDSRTQKKAFDIIAPVELNSEFNEFFHRKGCPS
ncbi:hypothetical protein SDC9_134224 [bioreactor metagenome]|uniref:Uncharacterized protein n=1 Tax=bioreactor metagenome TaxID=1076179 RepID=A0A645DCS3_9ZZZZ